MASIGVSGLRVDAAKHQDANELAQLLARVPGDLYHFHEVIAGAGEAVVPSMYFSIGQVTEFNYARQLAPNFLQPGKLRYLETFGESWGFMPSGSAVVFIDNHDTQRGEAQLTYKSGALHTLAAVFMLAHPYGYPRLMSSYSFASRDQGPPPVPVHRPKGGVSCGDGQPWVCEHRIPVLANMVAWRRAAGAAPITLFVAAPGGDAVALCRGAAACVAINRAAAAWRANLTLTLPAGAYHDVARASDVRSCPTVEVGAGGVVRLEVPAMAAVALHVDAQAAAEVRFA